MVMLNLCEQLNHLNFSLNRLAAADIATASGVHTAAVTLNFRLFAVPELDGYSSLDRSRANDNNLMDAAYL